MILLTSFYDAHDEARNAELLECVRRNNGCPAFSEAHYFLESSPEAAIAFRLWQGQLRLTDIKERMTYQGYFEYANKTFPPGTAVVVANADIWFDETLLNVNEQNLGPRDFFACSKWGFYMHPDGRQFWDEGFDVNAEISQDAWIFRTPIDWGKADLNFTMGCMRCDNVLAKAMQDAGYRVTNPTLPGPKSLKLHHEHRSQTHHYGAPVPGPMITVRPTQLT